MAIDSMGSFPNTDVFTYFVSFVGPKELCALEQVCREYNKWSKDGWKMVSATEGIPQVANLDGTARASPKEDFKVLYPITLSGMMIGEVFGRVVGVVPALSQHWFDMISQADPYEEKKKFEENFCVLVDPAFIERHVDQDTPLALDATGALVEVEKDQVKAGDLTIPFSLKNLIMLSQYPLKGKEHLPVFLERDWLDPANKASPPPSKIGVRIMRKLAIDEDFDLSFQKSAIDRAHRGFSLTPIRIRAIFDAFSILTTGTCPDRDQEDINPCVFMRSDEESGSVGSRSYPLMIGRFEQGKGVKVAAYFGHAYADIGVVPGAKADVESTRLALERLSLKDKKKD
jgi:hypothetical protein